MVTFCDHLPRNFTNSYRGSTIRQGTLVERILSPENLLNAYKAVLRNKGCSGINKMSCEQMLPWLLANKDALIRSLQDGLYRPNSVKRVEIPKNNGKMRLLSIPMVIDHHT